MDTFIIEFCYKNVTVKEDGNNFTANCQICPNKTISGSIRSSSNFLKHVKVRHPLRFKEYEKLKDVTWKKKKRILPDFDDATGSSAEAEPSPSGGRERRLLREIKKEDDVQAIFLGSDFGAEAGASPLGSEVPPGIQNDQGSPMVADVHLPEDSVYEDRRRRQLIILPTPTCQEVPWSGFEKAFTFVRQKGKNVVVQCNYCLPAIKHVSSAITSASNVKKHLERAHPEKLREIELFRKARRRGRYEPPADDEEPSPAKIPKQQEPAAPERWGSSREPVTQRILDRKIMDFIVEETLPLQTVEKASFVGLVRLGLPKDLTVMCAKTLRERIEKRVSGMQETLAHRMGAVEHVATTADCWLDGKKCFFGVTAHWICPTTLKREFGALACKLLRGRPTADLLAKVLHHVHVQYRIHNKVVCTTTDSGANFAKAFRLFRAREPSDDAGGPGDDDDGADELEAAEVEFVPISELLGEQAKAGDDADDAGQAGLPPHRRCASHTLNLVATEDLRAMVSDPSANSPLGPFRKLFCSLMEKCRTLWSKQSQSPQMAEYIQEQCGVRLKVPDRARWTSTFEALKQLSELLSSAPLKVDAVMDRCSLVRITAAEGLAVQEYAEIMGPLAQSLDILQRENGMFMGYLLPTLHNLDRKLHALESRPVRYTYGLPLLRGLREALRKRFAPIWEDKKLLLAACLHPRFKVDWLESAQTTQTNRYMMEALLKAEIRGTVSEDSDGSSEKDQEGDDLEDDFFNIQPRGRKSSVDTADEEVLRYLKSPSREVSSLHAFPRVLRCFLQYNTGVPSSAILGRLFGAGESAATAKRHALSDELFEQLVLLRQNMAAAAF